MASKNRSSDSKKGGNAAHQPPPWNDYLVCSFCKKDFNRKERCPISLGCGHTLCKTCLKKLKQPQCYFDLIPITCDINDLPENSALLQLLPGDSELKRVPPVIQHVSGFAGGSRDPSNISQYLKNYENAKLYIEQLTLYLDPSKSSELSRPMQRKLVALAQCQLCEDEGRKRGLRACRALGERTATELILLHQNPTTLSASLWAAVRARGCQFLGPAMQEEALKLIHLALEDGSELSRKVLVQIVVKNLQTQFSQASKTSIGHVVQLLYRASCFIVTKRDGESSLMKLRDDFTSYDDLRKEHDTQVVQIAREAGLRIAPDQWSALLYGDQVHKSEMQSIIDRLQSGASFVQCIKDFSLALQRSGDPGEVKHLLPHFNLLCEVNAEDLSSSWDALEKCTYSVKVAVDKLADFVKNHDHVMWQCQDATQQTSKYKTSMCRDCKNKTICPRGQACTFAHSEGELQFYRNRRKKGGQMLLFSEEFTDDELSPRENITEKCEDKRLVTANHDIPSLTSRPEIPPPIRGVPLLCGHTCQCNHNIQNEANLQYEMQSPGYCQRPTSMVNNSNFVSHAVSHHPNILSPNINHPSAPIQVGTGMPPQVAQVQNIQQHQSPHVQYIPQNHAVYEVQPQLPYDPVCQLVARNQAPTYSRNGDIDRVALPPSQPPKPVLPNIQQNHYMISRQQTAGYSPLQPNQVVQNVVQEPVAAANACPPIYPGGQSYTLAWQHGQQVAVPTSPPQPEVLPQTPILIQQSPVPMQNLPSNHAISYSPSMVMPVAPLPDLTSPPVTHPERKVSNLPLASVLFPSTESHLPPSIPLPTYNQYHVSVSVNGSTSPKTLELAKLNLRKDELINKLVQKRITATKTEKCQQQQFGSHHGVMEDKRISSHIPLADGDITPPDRIPSHVHISENSKLSVPLVYTNHISGPTVGTTKTCISMMNNQSAVPVSVSVTKDLTLTSDGQYCLWTGTTCIPSISGLSFQDLPSEKHEQSSPNIIDVMSDMDTSTSHVPAAHNANSIKYTHRSLVHTKENSLKCQTPFADDDIISIQDQRIVSKYGPIARTVRSKTTSAIPEQVTANANGNTQPFPSDVNRNLSNFVPDFGVLKNQSKLYTGISAEVEPSSMESVKFQSPRTLPDILTKNYSSGDSSFTTTQQTHQETMMNRERITEDNEDLLLAIELQQIEMGIQRIQRDTKTK